MSAPQIATSAGEICLAPLRRHAILAGESDLDRSRCRSSPKSAILTIISLHLGIAGLQALYQVSKAFYGLKEHLQKSHFNINKRLSDFVVCPDMFRSQLGKYNALISGGFALNFFGLDHWKVPNLDIFIEAGTHAVDFTNYIQKDEGYDTSTEGNSNDETVPERLILVNSTRPGIKLRVICTNGPPIYTILSSAYTTACVNLITWNKAYSVFPRQTLIHHKSYPLKPMDDGFGSALREYSKQGWTTRDMVWPELPENQVRIIGGKRRVGDSSSLVISLDTSSVQSALTPDYVIEHAQFEVFAEQSNISLRFNRVPQSQDSHIRVHQLKSPALRYGYTASEPWRAYVAKKLQRWAWIELYKLKPAERPEQFAHGIPDLPHLSLPEEFRMPESWDYADDRLPLWYLEWEQMPENNESRFILR
ncbi:hypothetical protein BU23DRAFT_644310 [Bimuria novae-zelandiae CBS 107.79]|uniref:Uncharacterized protein n=1 Tax=Bimuria novae-zelandiae CBS 107.79 TaxID=1447943 RepID=A0A6A5V5G8_9PLEO|nr:hypothetical protein BU23DRAFT_644310 [Bimuria novae-zelandiae CBS 107.79]